MRKFKISPPLKISDTLRAKVATLRVEAAVSDSQTPAKGLGDQVEKIAQPIAKVIDRVAGTNVQGCGGCQKRKEWLNKHFPDQKH